MPCRRKDIPGRPNNKTKAGGGRQVGGRRERRKGAPGLAVTRRRIRGGTIESCACLFVIFVPSLCRCCNPLLLEHLDFFQWKLFFF